MIRSIVIAILVAVIFLYLEVITGNPLFLIASLCIVIGGYFGYRMSMDDVTEEASIDPGNVLSFRAQLIGMRSISLMLLDDFKGSKNSKEYIQAKERVDVISEILNMTE